MKCQESVNVLEFRTQNSLSLMMIRSPRYNLLRAVELLNQDEADELVREDGRGERPYEVGALLEFVGDAVGAANDNHNAP